MTRRKNRSDSYQHLLQETPCSYEVLTSFSNRDSISNKIDPFKYDERLLDLQDELRVEFWRVVDTLLTERQKKVLKMSAQKMTQTEIAKELGVNQSSITKSLHGNVDYKNGRKSYGGSFRRLKKLIQEDPVITRILQEMAEIREEKD